MEELENIDRKRCQGCSKKKKMLFSSFSNCRLCGNLKSAKPFCKKCCLRINYKLSDSISFAKYCFVCYWIIESSKQEELPSSDSLISESTLPTESEVKFI